MANQSLRVLLLGATGTIGRATAGALVAAGHEVVNVTRGLARPYLPHAAWGRVADKVSGIKVCQCGS